VAFKFSPQRAYSLGWHSSTTFTKTPVPAYHYDHDIYLNRGSDAGVVDTGNFAVSIHCFNSYTKFFKYFVQMLKDTILKR